MTRTTTERFPFLDNSLVPIFKRRNNPNSFYSVKSNKNNVNDKKKKDLRFLSVGTHNIAGTNPFEKDWRFLDAGTYNIAWINSTMDTVYKQPRATSNMDTPRRSVRIFNELNNPVLEAKIYKGLWWELPFVHGKKPDSGLLAQYLFNTYCTTSRIILDGYCKDNILEQDKTQQMVCIDPGLAIRRKSVHSESFWYQTHRPSVQKTRLLFTKHMLKTIQNYYGKNKAFDGTPVLIILALIYHDDQKNSDNNREVAMKYHNFLILGIYLYFHYSVKNFPPITPQIEDNILNDESVMANSMKIWQCYLYNNPKDFLSYLPRWALTNEKNCVDDATTSSVPPLTTTTPKIASL